MARTQQRDATRTGIFSAVLAVLHIHRKVQVGGSLEVGQDMRGVAWALREYCSVDKIIFVEMRSRQSMKDFSHIGVSVVSFHT
jgi:hypothetical protein